MTLVSTDTTVVFWIDVLSAVVVCTETLLWTETLVCTDRVVCTETTVAVVGWLGRAVALHCALLLGSV